jgi:hypothetical protein
MSKAHTFQFDKFRCDLQLLPHPGAAACTLPDSWATNFIPSDTLYFCVQLACEVLAVPISFPA